MGMSIISLENRKGVSLGSVLNVRRGFGRYLVAQGKAVKNNAANQAQFAAMRSELEKQALVAREVAEKRVALLQTLNVSIASSAADESRLYGSLGVREIAKAITEAGVPVEKQEIRLLTGPIRHLGDHEIEIYLHSEVSAILKIQVISEN